MGTYPDTDVVLDLPLVQLRVVAVRAHQLRLQDVSRTCIQTEEGAVQLCVFVYANIK